MTQEPEYPNTPNLERVIGVIQSIPIPQPPSNNELLARVRVGSLKNHPVTRSQPATGKTFRWARELRITAGALLILTATAGWLFLDTSKSIAIAQVINSTAMHRLVKYKIHKVGVFKDEYKDRYIGDANNWYVMYTDLKSPRMRLEQPTSETLNEVAEQTFVEILDYSTDRYLQLNRFDLILAEDETNDETQKKLIQSILKEGNSHTRIARLFRVPRDEDGSKFLQTKPYSDMGKDHSFLDTLRSMQNRKDVVTSRDQIDGHDTVIYRLEEDDWTSTVWVDTRTRLPVRIEHLLVGDGTGKQFASLKWSYTDFEWDPKIDDIEALFGTKAPEGYRLEDNSNK